MNDLASIEMARRGGEHPVGMLAVDGHLVAGWVAPHYQMVAAEPVWATVDVDGAAVGPRAEPVAECARQDDGIPEKAGVDVGIGCADWDNQDIQPG